MMAIRRSAERGHANHGWLDTFHTFSFGGYFDPQWTQFGHLRVLNQDRVEAGRGFGTHGHQDMEIVTYVLEGELEHQDSMGHGSRMRPGEVQVMSAGSGVTHSEFNASREEPLAFLQMWVLPAKAGTPPRYEQKRFEALERETGRLHLVASPDGSDGSLTIGQDARLYAGRFAAGQIEELPWPTERIGWLHVARGQVRIGSEILQAGDGAALRDEDRLGVEALEASEVVLWELPSMEPV